MGIIFMSSSRHMGKDTAVKQLHMKHHSSDRFEMASAFASTPVFAASCAATFADVKPERCFAPLKENHEPWLAASSAATSSSWSSTISSDGTAARTCRNER